ncbi:MAG: DoxX family protein [Chlamydiae bacterium]|nr:DoxX family protein [Chlamydiota bacterium]
MNRSLRFLAAIGRIFISLIFLIMGAANVYNWQVAEVDMARALSLWQAYTGHMVAVIPVLMAILVAMQLVGGALLFLGCYVRLAAFLLLMYLIPVTIVCHPFWFLSGPEQSLALVVFLKNLAVIGGLIVVLALGKGYAKNKDIGLDSK